MAKHYVGQQQPEEPTLQDIADEIDNLKGMLGNTLDGIVSIQNSIKEIKRTLAELPDEIERS